MRSFREARRPPQSKQRNPQIQTGDCHLRNYLNSSHHYQVMHKYEVNLIKVRGIRS